MRTLTAYLVLCAVAVFGFPVRAEAYLDPTAGSIALQVVMGGVLAASAAIKVYWSSIRSFFSRKRRPRTSR